MSAAPVRIARLTGEAAGKLAPATGVSPRLGCGQIRLLTAIAAECEGHGTCALSRRALCERAHLWPPQVTRMRDVLLELGLIAGSWSTGYVLTPEGLRELEVKP